MQNSRLRSESVEAYCERSQTMIEIRIQQKLETRLPRRTGFKMGCVLLCVDSKQNEKLQRTIMYSFVFRSALQGFPGVSLRTLGVSECPRRSNLTAPANAVRRAQASAESPLSTRRRTPVRQEVSDPQTLRWIVWGKRCRPKNPFEEASLRATRKRDSTATGSRTGRGKRI